jgi:hypothetical protein
MRRALRTMVGCILATSAALACDRRAIDPTPALSQPGTPVPPFIVARYGRADSVRAADLRGTPTILALWSTHCPYQGPWVASFDSLARAYSPRGVRVVVLADDAPGATLDSVLQRATWREAVSVIGVASGALTSWFDRSREAPERTTERVEFVLPSFLLIDANGQVVRRAWGPGVTSFRSGLDSLLHAVPVSNRAPAG